jgi:FKBP-type peptidyl-prolyl cis-trans isomerase
MKKYIYPFILFFSFILIGFSAENKEQITQDSTVPSNTIKTTRTSIVSGLSIRILKRGDGASAQVGNKVKVHYTGWIYNSDSKSDFHGKKFDSSHDRGIPFEFKLGEGRVIRGWDLGVVGMQIGEVRELLIAPNMGYGNRAVGNLIPPKSTLVFEVELLGF